MKTLGHWSFGVGLFFVLAFGVGHCFPVWANRQGLDFWNTWKLLDQLRRGEQLKEDLEAQDQIALRNLEIKTALAEDLIAQRRTLREVVDRLREQNAITAFAMERIRDLFPGQSDDECLARHMILYVRGILANEPHQAAVVSRLEAELLSYPTPAPSEVAEPFSTAMGPA